nr:RecName: Full=General stress protein 9; Short=GSP9 [Bacillus subtilis]
SRDIVSVYDD